jgi:hypothetical protein
MDRSASRRDKVTPLHGPRLTAEDLACVYISVINFYDPQWSAPNSILNWIEQNASTLLSLATTVARALG